MKKAKVKSATHQFEMSPTLAAMLPHVHPFKHEYLRAAQRGVVRAARVRKRGRVPPVLFGSLKWGAERACVGVYHRCCLAR